MNKKGFIFDLDGVIVDTAKYHFLAWKNLAEELNIPFTEVQNEQLKGISRIESLKKILEWGNLTISKEHFNELMAEKNEEYLRYISEMTKAEILPDVVSTLAFLKNNNQKIALGSASKNAKAILKKVGLLTNFEIIIDGNKVTKAKPNPEVFTKAAVGLKVAIKDCIVFEDSVAGIKAANSGGMMSIGIGSKKVLFEADYIFNDFTEISSEFLQKIMNN